MMGFGEDGEERVVVELVFCWREVGGEDVACSSVKNQSGGDTA